MALRPNSCISQFSAILGVALAASRRWFKNGSMPICKWETSGIYCRLVVNLSCNLLAFHAAGIIGWRSTCQSEFLESAHVRPITHSSTWYQNRGPLHILVFDDVFGIAGDDKCVMDNITVIYFDRSPIRAGMCCYCCPLTCCGPPVIYSKVQYPP